MANTNTIEELHKLYAAGEAKPSEIINRALDRAEAVNERLNAYLTINREGALKQAAALDADIQAALKDKPLAGIPVVVKDNMCTTGVRTTCGSHILGNYVPPYNATVINQLEAAGAIIIGKTNLDEFAMGGSTENSGFGPARNPINPDYVPGGSSGGSAVAVAAGHAEREVAGQDEADLHALGLLAVHADRGIRPQGLTLRGDDDADDDVPQLGLLRLCFLAHR